MSKPRIQDDLYNHVNYEKLQELVIPDDQPCVGGFQTLAVELEKLMIGEFKQMSESAVYPNAHLERAVKLFNVAKDVEKKNKDGIDLIAGCTGTSSGLKDAVISALEYVPATSPAAKIIGLVALFGAFACVAAIITYKSIKRRRAK